MRKRTVKKMRAKRSRQPLIEMGSSSVQGSRTEQQDTVLVMQTGTYHIGVICDGMGGMRDGARAGRLAAEMLARDLPELAGEKNIAAFLQKEAREIDAAIHGLRDETGALLGAGTTLVLVVIRGKEFYWLSAGDSRIYLIQDGNVKRLTRDHNYRLTLDVLKAQGKISEKDYQKEIQSGEALISYLGIGGIELVDGNTEAGKLRPGDILVLCSDGLYRHLPEKALVDIIQKYEDAEKAARALTEYVLSMKIPGQDNTSVILARYGGTR